MTSFTRRAALKSLITIAMLPALPSLASAQTALSWTAMRGDENDFARAPVLLTGEQDAILIDGSFNFGAGAALADQIKASGKNLTTIFITISDPDYYFSLKPVLAAFPDARVLAAPDTVEKIRATVDGKIAQWGPILGEYGPQSLDDIVFPEAYADTTLTLEGQTINIVNSDTMADRRYLYVPSLNAVVGGIYAFDGVHVWTADSPTVADRANWIAELDALIALNPDVVVAGHAASGTNNGVASLVFTRDYLIAFEAEVAKAADSAALVTAMQGLYPDLGLIAALDIGAKVVTGEMEWG